MAEGVFPPIIGQYGSVFLNSFRFTTDPNPYDPLNWQTRQSVHPYIRDADDISDPGVVIQDFGMAPGDLVLELASNGGNTIMDLSVVRAFQNMMLVTGAVYPFTDWLENDFLVKIMKFHPIPLIKGQNAEGEDITLFHYTMSLNVVLINKLLGRIIGAT